MVADTLINHMAIISLQEQWHAYVQMQEYQGIKQTILFELQMPHGFLILMLMSNSSWKGRVILAVKVSYKCTSEAQREKLSDILNCSKKPCLQKDIQRSSSLSCDFSTKLQHSLQQQGGFMPGSFNLHQCSSVTINFNTVTRSEIHNTEN